MKERESFGSRIGFILISAGCAIGLGNVWRFPYIVGKNGGAAFILIYLAFLLLLGMPVLTMEFSIGRASRTSIALSFQKLEPAGSKWHIFRWIGIIGCYMLMMFYAPVSGWMFSYLVKSAVGDFAGLTPDAVAGEFGAMLSDPYGMTMALAVVVLLGFFVCSLGLQKGVEKVTKIMMGLLVLLIGALAVRSVTLPGAGAGLKYYLVPDINAIRENGLFNVLYEALNQAFFTLSMGIGAMSIFGSYIGRERRLFGEALNVGVLDTFVAFCSGLVIIPACFAFGISSDSGPNLIFITLPNVFNHMMGGRFWGTLFFLFMCFAAMSTIIAVFENIISMTQDMFGWERKKACVINLLLIFVLSLPCVLGFNLWSGFQPLGAGSTVQDLEDFIVSGNLLPIGSLTYVLFCTRKNGWGWKNFLKEANAGEGIAYPDKLRGYMSYVVPAVIVIILAVGYVGYWKKIFGM
ncbi:MAG: sodium-dependent transporter [Clostridiaceae bacterium]|nr:sodium-dependent transporter [Clostridiaceae bacterium]MCI9484607.1 sodium-dependent transporter [Clostridiaceae bacterium]NBH79942.1 sodium-dependent transporter [Clostridiaceae bacterium]NBI81529.1 sodium-dependent transporter [Clostridiaceae bacterium]